MILLASKLFKVLLALFLVCIGWVLFRKKLSPKTMLSLSALIVVFAFVSNYISGFFPPLTDRVILTALGTKNNEAQGSEVYLSGYTIDGQDFSSGESLQIVEGHWFWSGETYAWRPKTDSRQPKGVTETVVINIPVGWSRTLNFASDVWRGNVSITIHENTEVVDTYADEATIQRVPIEKSDTKTLVYNQIQYLGLYSFILFSFFMLIVLIVRAILYDPIKANEWFSQNWNKLICGGIAVITFFLMFHYADLHTFWIDEVHQIGVTNGTLKEALQYCLDSVESTPPFSLLIATIWYRIAPYGETWLLLMSMILSALSIYYISLIADKLLGKSYGVMSSIIMACSTTMWLNVAYEYRTYPFLVLFSTLTLYSYVMRNEDNLQKKWNIIFSIFLLCLAMSHYFGMLACAGYFCADIWLFLKKKRKYKDFFSYLLPGIGSVLWMGSLYFAKFQYRAPWEIVHWQPVPDLRSIDSLIHFLTGNTNILYLAFIIGTSVTISFLIASNSRGHDEINFYRNFFVGMIFGTIILVAFYGCFINSRFTLWAERYFLSIFPHVCMVCTWMIFDINVTLNRVIKDKKLLEISMCILLTILLPLSACQSILNPKAQPWEPFKNAADWIYTQSNYIFNDDTLIICSQSLVPAVDGWSEYYVERQGRRDPLNIVSKYEVTADELMQNKYIYLQYIHNDALLWIKDFLSENYKLVTDKTDVKVKVYVRK